MSRVSHSEMRSRLMPVIGACLRLSRMGAELSISMVEWALKSKTTFHSFKSTTELLSGILKAKAYQEERRNLGRIPDVTETMEIVFNELNI